MKVYGYSWLLSVLPTSYPGHNILTEDIGVILGEDNCSCGKRKVFSNTRKSQKCRLRGCSDAI